MYQALVTKELLEYGHKKGILTLCQDLHMTNTGSYEDMDDAEYEMALDFLKYKYSNWESGLPQYKEYEFAVRFLIGATILECETTKYRYK